MIRIGDYIINFSEIEYIHIIDKENRIWISFGGSTIDFTKESIGIDNFDKLLAFISDEARYQKI